MPYTPPAHCSPTSTTPSSPDVSRRSSINGSTVSTGSSGSGSKPALPRSASYLTKYRRTPTATAPSAPATSISRSFSNSTPPGTSDNLQAMGAHSTPGSIRQSPPPITDRRIMPAGAIISPPDSQSSSEDEGTAGDSRGRQIENLKELQDAISAIPQHRGSSPDRSSPGDLLVLPSQIGDLVDAVSQEFDVEIHGGASKMCPRKIAHSRSNTEPVIFRSKSAGASPTISEDSDQDVPPRKPQMVRKKSGELVRPALRPASSKRRPSSMPGTPTFSKAVHFDSHLEHVRHFLQVDRPLAVSAGSSPADNYESDTEYPFFPDEKGSTRSPPYEWELIINNFPQDSPIRKSMPVRVERVWMSNDQKFLHGSVVVANLAFQKFVVCRFTFDYWKTVSEVTAEYSHEIRPKETEQGHDRFHFTIKLSDLANLESKTLFFCVKYIVNGHEYWDNNNHLNFQVDFRKKMLPQNGKNNFQGAASRSLNSLPRTRRSATSRPKPALVGADDFGRDPQMMKFDQPIHEYLGESAPTLRLKSSKSTSSLPSDNLANRLSAPSGLAFANRYDFGASLTAAKQAKKELNGSPRSRAPDVLYMKPKASFGPPVQTSLNKPKVDAAGSSGPHPTSIVPGTDSPASSITAASYEEIVNKYCFFNGSKQSSPQLRDGTMQNGRYDGASDSLFTLTGSNSSSSNSSPEHQTGGLRYTAQQNYNPYFHNAQIVMGGSTNESWGSPKSSPPLVRSGSPLGSDFDPFGGSIDGPFGPHLSDRFPFNTDTHPSPAIRG